MLDNENITSANIPYPDVENGQPMDESIFDDNNKALLDKINELIDAVNNIKNTLSSSEDGDSGADNIAISPITALNATQVQEALEELKQNITDTILGDIPDYSLTSKKFQVGSLMAEDVIINQDVIQAFDLNSLASSVNDALLRLHNAYISLPDLKANVAYMIAKEEIEGTVQFYKNVFYDLFYENQDVNRIGRIDNRRIPYTGLLTAGTTEIPIANLDVSTWRDVPWANQDYIGMIISDGSKYEKIFVKNVTSSFKSSEYTGTYPVSMNLSSGKYTITMGGGKGEDLTFNDYTTYGGKGGTISFNLDLAESANIQIKKVMNNGEYGASFWLLVDGEVYAAVGGGGSGWFWHHLTAVEGGYYNPQHGGDGGSDIGEDGDGGIRGGKGANGGIGGLGGIPDYKVENHGPAPNGYNYNDPTYPGRGGGNGGCGYAGGGSGCIDYPDWGMRSGAGGGGSSYIISDASVTVIENTRGTNNGVAYINITPTTNLSLKTPLTNSYSNPIIYRSNLLVDTTNHHATIQPINGIDQTESIVRIIVTNPDEKFYDIASWIEMTPNLNVSEVSVSLSDSPDFDESNVVDIQTFTYSDNNVKQVRFERNSFDGYRYAVIEFKLSVSNTDSAYLYKMLGVIN